VDAKNKTKKINRSAGREQPRAETPIRASLKKKKESRNTSEPVGDEEGGGPLLANGEKCRSLVVWRVAAPPSGAAGSPAISIPSKRKGKRTQQRDGGVRYPHEERVVISFDRPSSGEMWEGGKS